MYKYVLILTLSLPGCYEEIDVQINPYICINDYQWDLEGSAIVNDFGAQKTCTQRLNR
jgi:hypothetical protein